MYFSNLIPQVVKELESTMDSSSGKPIEELSLEDFSVAPIWEWDYGHESISIKTRLGSDRLVLKVYLN